mmetsp:Transcript_114938/g.287238  ORF Transcript_114938/g.287238 Transcript_114938/m.287238 type:complete len:212 (-) Transcript_114938:940-1575(-)
MLQRDASDRRNAGREAPMGLRAARSVLGRRLAQGSDGGGGVRCGRNWANHRGPRCLQWQWWWDPAWSRRIGTARGGDGHLVVDVEAGAAAATLDGLGANLRGGHVQTVGLVLCGNGCATIRTIRQAVQKRGDAFPNVSAHHVFRQVTQRHCPRPRDEGLEPLSVLREDLSGAAAGFGWRCREGCGGGGGGGASSGRGWGSSGCLLGLRSAG